ncbi:outer membrane protein assembly factor BamD [Marinobacter sp.]|uniref:outer membrane protein assembly factor BamD n=1 Tax=Marinobacter sp. TaxID=50741 RepID=UPI0035672EAA
MRSGFRCALLAATLVLGACASTQDDQDVLPEEAYYDNARKAMNSGNFNEAESNLDQLETYYPFGRYAEQAQLDLIYARYQNLDLEGARSAADRFLRLNPQSEHADYALYMRGLASYNLDVGLATRYLGVDPTDRDPGEQRQAFQDFSELLDRYPDSQYAPDARQRMIAIRNRLAELELHAARYYVRRQAYMAANNRARYVVENFPDSPSTEEALVLMAETYQALDLDDAAKDAVRLLAVNHPESEAFDGNMQFQGRDLTPENRSLLNVMTFGLFGRD